MRILLDKILKSKVGCPPKNFSKIKNIYIDHEKNVKKDSNKAKSLLDAKLKGLYVFKFPYYINVLSISYSLYIFVKLM